MHAKARLAFAAALVLAATGMADAQQIEWTQTINIPKGAKLPPGVSADILGIALGDSFAEVKAKLDKLMTEPTQPNASSDPKVQPVDRILYFELPNRSRIEITFPGQLVMQRYLPAKDLRGVREHFTVYFSAPSSGQQVLSMERSLIYFGDADQPRVSEILAALKAKLKAEPSITYSSDKSRHYRFVYDDGKIAPPNTSSIVCQGLAGAGDFNRASTASSNREGFCDVVFRVEFRLGISPDHAETVIFTLSDNDRGKANLTADFKFFDDYLAKYRQGGGAAPKL